MCQVRLILFVVNLILFVVNLILCKVKLTIDTGFPISESRSLIGFVDS